MWNFCLFELRYRLKSLTTYIFIAWFITLFMIALFEDIQNIAGHRSEILNSSWNINMTVMMIYIELVFMMFIFIYQMFYKSLNKKFYEILFTKPISKYQYVFGSFLGNLIVIFGAFMLALIVWRVVMSLANVSPELIMPDIIWLYITPAFVSVLPNLIVCGFFCMAAVLLTKRTSGVFIVCFLYFISLMFTDVVGISEESGAWKHLLDISGTWALIYEYPSAGGSQSELMTHIPGLSFNHIMNRVFWVGVSSGVLVFALCRFDRDLLFKNRGK